MVSNPEFLKEGAAIEDFMRPDRIVVGSEDERATQIMRALYAPFQRNLDMSIIKDFRFGEKRAKTVQLRLDAFNAFNYRGMKVSGTNSFNGAYVFNAPSTADLPVANYNTWAGAWNTAHAGDQVPLQTSGQPNNAVYQQIVNLTAVPRAANSGVLPRDFFSIPVPGNFAGLSANSFDLRTPDGLKLYQLRSVYNSVWGTLSDPANARYLQVSVRFTF